jgi:hypothetical protein
MSGAPARCGCASIPGYDLAAADGRGLRDAHAADRDECGVDGAWQYRGRRSLGCASRRRSRSASVTLTRVAVRCSRAAATVAVGRWIGTDARGWEQLGALVRRPRRAAARAAVLRHRRPDSGPLLVEGRVRVEFIALPPRRACGGAARRRSCATRTLSSSPANASRSPSSRANSSSAQRVVSASVRCCQPAPDRGHPEGATGEALFHGVQT